MSADSDTPVSVEGSEKLPAYGVGRATGIRRAATQTLWVARRGSPLFGAQRFPRPLLLGVVLIAVVITILNGRFLTYGNFTNMALSASLVGIAALAQTIVLIGGGFDLSIGAMAAVAGFIAAELLSAGLPTAVAIGATVGCAGCLGLLNGIITTVVGINPIIATLATSSIFYGGILIYTHGLAVIYPPEKLSFANDTVFGVSFSFIVYAALLLVCGFVLHFTSFGWHLYNLGANRVAARASGIRVTAVGVSSYVASGVLAGCAGVLLIVQLGTAIANAGDSWLLTSIAAPIIGGVSVTGGAGTLFGGFLGIALLTQIDNGLVLTGFSSYSRGTALGVAILAAMLAQTEIRSLIRNLKRR
jgi:ribose transport system permease protein